jgi:2-polyprenyl-6-methoxyphenol hydroxylase-like FAD-dependent oxidoreductase
MKVACVGGGPAGLYFAILMKRRDPDHEITVFERDPAGWSHGWGMVFWDAFLDRLDASDAESGRRIRENSVRWHDQVLDVDGRRTVYPDRGGYGIGRQRLLKVLAERASELGVGLRFDSEIEDPAQVLDTDLIVACDGAASRLRQSRADRFKTRISVGRNKYLWLGTNKVFDTFTFAFVKTAAGWIWFHGYCFDKLTSTCVIECTPETWAGLHLDTLGPEETLDLLSAAFAGPLDGETLLDRGARWLNFRTVTNETWHEDNVVLMGDAAHTTHFTIGSGMRLALDDATALRSSLHENPDLASALDAYQRERQRALRRPQAEARLSSQWFENVPIAAGLSDRELFTLLRRRRSPLLPRLAPLTYYRLQRLGVVTLPARWLWRRVRSKARAGT